MIKSILIKFDLNKESDRELYNKVISENNKTAYIKSLIRSDKNIRQEMFSVLQEFFGESNGTSSISTKQVFSEVIPQEKEEFERESSSMNNPNPLSFDEFTDDDEVAEELEEGINDSAMAFLDSLGD